MTQKVVLLKNLQYSVVELEVHSFADCKTN